MNVARFEIDGKTTFGVIDGESVLDLSEEIGSFNELLEKTVGGFEPESGGREHSREEIQQLPPTTERNTVFAAALNYESHVRETSMAVPERPLLFLKPHRSLVGDREVIPYYSTITTELDYEAELTAVIGKPTWNVSESDALDYVAGYTILNDVTSRNVQQMKVGDKNRMDWFSSKALQKSTPVGPHLVTADEIRDPMDLRIKSWVNGEKMQDESSKLMIRSVSELVSFASSRVKLQPGDLIATGTPEGVGHWQDLNLVDGDEVKIEIEDIGTLVNTVQKTD